jgi:hypothetical protein
MEYRMAGVTVSFVADPALAARVKDIARADGITPSQAAARASALGTLVPAAARRTLRFILAEGGEAAQRDLATLITRAIAQVGNQVLERRLLAEARPDAAVSEDAIAAEAVQAVADYRRSAAGSRSE